MPAYNQVNARTISDITAINDSQQQKWVLKVMVESRGKHPLKSLMGGYKGGRPFIEIMDTRKLAGDTVKLTTQAPLGGAGIQGDNPRAGNEEKSRHNVYSFVIGTKWHGVSWTKVAAAQSVIGSNLDKTASSMLAEWLAWQQGWDLEMEMVVKASPYNTIRPNYRRSRDELGTADYLSGETVTRAGTRLGLNQGKKLLQATSKAGAPIKKYLLVSPNYALKEWKASPSYATAVTTGFERGTENPLWAGGIPDYMGHLIWEWEVEISSQYGPVGAVCVPIAVLGNAITAANTAQDITGGGDAAGAALTDRLYFLAFSNAAYTGFEGTKRAAVTNVRRQVMIKSGDTGLFGFYSFLVNNGNKLTMDERLRAVGGTGIAKTILTGATIEWGVAPWTANYLTDSHPEGSEIYEVNSKGVPICYSYMLADEALITGYGSFEDGLAMGNRTEEKQDHGRLYAVGIDAIWGCKAIPRTDGKINGYILIESGFKVDGMPDVD